MHRLLFIVAFTVLWLPSAQASEALSTHGFGLGVPGLLASSGDAASAEDGPAALAERAIARRNRGRRLVGAGSILMAIGGVTIIAGIVGGVGSCSGFECMGGTFATAITSAVGIILELIGIPLLIVGLVQREGGKRSLRELGVDPRAKEYAAELTLRPAVLRNGAGLQLALRI
jgi:hypothetical protein